jgi:uncharacterized membrane protein
MIFLIFQTNHLFKLTLSNKLQNYLSIFCKKVKMENSKRTMVTREKRAITNYYIIKPYLQQKNVSDFNPTVEKQHFAL